METLSITENKVKEIDLNTISDAELFGVLATGETFQIALGADIYELLDDVREKSPLAISGLGVVTSGWACPLDENGEATTAPSLHPERKRVGLVTLITAEGLVSSMKFADGDEVISDTTGQGSLAIALNEAFVRLTV